MRAQMRDGFLLDTSLSSSPIPEDSTRHSVTSRIERNSRFLRYLTFSTRHLNATPENRENVEKFNTRLRFYAASDHPPPQNFPSSFRPASKAARNSGRVLLTRTLVPETRQVYAPTQLNSM